MSVSRRNITIAVIIILGVLALATWGGTRLGNTDGNQPAEETQAQLAAVTEELAQAQQEYALLQEEQETLNSRLSATTASLLEVQTLYAALEQENEDLQLELAATKEDLQLELAAALDSLATAQANYDRLQQSNTLLQTQLTTALADLAEIRANYQSLQQENDALRAELSGADAKYNSLYQQYLALEATTLYTSDNRFAVSFTAEYQDGEITRMRGEVTNISGQTIGRLYALVSYYKKATGALDRVDFLHPALMLNLAPGQTVTFIFYITSSETAKVTILADN
jgi:septal ring factor EnvC (AmiA/AmiB activator)